MKLSEGTLPVNLMLLCCEFKYLRNRNGGLVHSNIGRCHLCNVYRKGTPSVEGIGQATPLPNGT